MRYINHAVSIAAVAAECVLFAVGAMNLAAFLVSVIPTIVTLVISIIDGQKQRNRKKKIKTLRRMYELTRVLPDYYAEQYRVQKNRERAGWPPLNASVEYAKTFEVVRPEILDFVSLFKLGKQSEEILRSFRSTPEQARRLLKRLETDLHLNEYEDLLLKAEK